MKVFTIPFLLLVSIECAFSQDESTCTVDVSERERITRIGANIVNQLGLPEAPENPKGPVLVPQSKIDEFHVLQETSGVFIDSEEACAQPEVFAVEKRAFLPNKAEAYPSDPKYFEKSQYLGENYIYNTRSWRDSSTSPLPHSTPPYVYSLSFNLDLSSESMFTLAELLLFKRALGLQGRSKFTEFETVQIKFVYKTYYYYYGYLMREDKELVVETKIISTDNDEYVSFNATDAVDKWLEINQASAGMIDLEVVISCPESLSSKKMFLPAVEFDVGSEPSNTTAKLVVSFLKLEELNDMSSPSSSAGMRRKRQVTRLDGPFCYANPKEPNCCIRNLTIDFEKDFGWTWILSPKSYDPNYCTGLCPYFWPSISDSTRLLQTYRAFNPASAVEPCCAPEKLKPLVVMYAASGRLVLQLLNNMIVDNCICR